MDVDDCLDHYTKSHDFWTKKEMFTYLVAAKAADWKTPEECGLKYHNIHGMAREGMENMLATAILREDAYTPEFMAWVAFKGEFDRLDAMHLRGLNWKEDGEDKFREAHLVLVKRKWNVGGYWKSALHEGAHHGGISKKYEDEIEKLENCVERDEEAEDSIMEELEEEGAFIEVENVGVKSGGGKKPRPDDKGGDSGGGGGGSRPVRMSCTVSITEICVAVGEEIDEDDCEVFYKFDCNLASLFEKLGIQYAGLGARCPAIPAGPLPPGDRPARVAAAIDRPRGYAERAEVDSRALRARPGRRWGPVRVVATR